MANQTVSASTNFDVGPLGLTNGDDITIDSGAVLTINSDVRWAQNAAVIGAITITNGQCLMDGTATWWIAYDGGASTVPNIGDTITGATSGATGEFIGLFTAYGVAPSAAGGATPATGFIKLRSKSGTFQDNENLQVAGVTKGVVNSATGGKRGWIHIVGEETQIITVPRLGKLRIVGDWFELDTTCSGARNQTIQLPVADHHPGVWIETGSGTGVYEFYPNAGVDMTATNFPASNQGRNKVVFISSGGLLRIGATSGGTNAGFLPASGCKIRIPNVIISSSTSANWNNNTLSATLTTRWSVVSTGDIDIDHLCGAGFYLGAAAGLSQCYSFSMTNSAYMDRILFTQCLGVINFNNVGFGTTASLLAVSGVSMQFLQCFAGATITDCYIFRILCNNALGICLMQDCKNFSFTRVKAQGFQLRTIGGASWACQRADNITWTDCIAINAAGMNLNAASNALIQNLKYSDQPGDTTSTVASKAIDLQNLCTNVIVDGFSNYEGVANVHPYENIVQTSAHCLNIKIRNIGSPSSPYDGGSANAMGYIYKGLGADEQVKVQRCYAQNLRVGVFSQVVNEPDAIFESVWGDGADVTAINGQNVQVKGCKFTNSTTGQTTVNGSHFMSLFTSTTAGRLVIAMNEKTAASPSSSAYSVVAGTPKFNGSGQVLMIAANDEILWEWDHFVLGYTAFTDAQVTVTGTNPNNHDWYYKIDTGAGFNASYRNLDYKRAGGGGSGGSTTVTMTSTTGVNVNDRVYGTGIGVGAKVVSIDSSTNITVSVVNAGAVSGVLSFNQLPQESALDPATGFKLRVRVVANAASATNALTYLSIPMTCTDASQDQQYPLDVVPLTVTVKDAADSSLIEGARVYMTADAGGPATEGTVILNALTDSNGIASEPEYEFTTDQPVVGTIRRGSASPFYQSAVFAGTTTENGLDITVFMVTDE